MIPPRRQYKVKNTTGVTLAAGAVKLYMTRRFTDIFGLGGIQSKSSALTNSATIANNAWGDVGGVIQDETIEQSIESEGVMETTTTGSPTGDVALWLYPIVKDYEGTDHTEDDGSAKYVFTQTHSAAGTKKDDIKVQ